MKLAIGSDHSAFDLKQYLMTHLKNAGHDVQDVGCYSKESVDYPDIAAAVAEKIVSQQCVFGVMLDGAGVGSCMAANKINGIRAALCNDLYTARNAREHNNANMLLLGSMVVGPGKASQILDIFLTAQYEGGRHQRRVDKLMNLETRMHDKPAISADSATIGDLVRRVLSSVNATPQLVQPAICGTPVDTTPQKPMVVTEDWLRSQVRSGVPLIRLPRGSLITPLAKDYIKDQKLQIEYLA